MDSLVKTIKIILDLLFSFEKLLKEENKNLLDRHSNMKTFIYIMTKKNILLKKINATQKDRLLLEKKNDVFAPYLNNKLLNNYWCKITKQSLLLKILNTKNKKILDKKYHINQNFLDLVKVYSKNCTYDVNGDLRKLK